MPDLAEVLNFIITVVSNVLSVVFLQLTKGVTNASSQTDFLRTRLGSIFR
jgi:hypothetical protein